MTQIGRGMAIRPSVTATLFLRLWAVEVLLCTFCGFFVPTACEACCGMAFYGVLLGLVEFGGSKRCGPRWLPARLNGLL